MRTEFARIASELGVRDAESVAGQLMLARDGAMVNGYHGDSPSISTSLRAVSGPIIAASSN